jgi:hypothetical protein
MTVRSTDGRVLSLIGTHKTPVTLKKKHATSCRPGLPAKMLVEVRAMSADPHSLFGEKSRPSLRFVRWREGSRSPIGAVESAERNSHSPSATLSRKDSV